MENSEEYGPALPPGMIAAQRPNESSSRPKIIGPAVPGNLRKSSDSDDLSDEGQLMVKMESDMSPEHNDSTVGPMPSEMATEGESAAKTADEFEKRSKRMKDKLGVKVEADDGAVKREEWMTELPPEMGKNFGLVNRQFAAKPSGDQGEDSKDRSSWTDTPSIKKEKDSKGKKRKREEEKALSSRDQKLHQQVDDYNKDKRSESLMDIHSKKLKKKKKKERKEKKKKKERGEKEEKEVRRPFDRDKDLGIQDIDEAKRKAIIQRSAMLNTRFNFGESTSHFL